MNKYFLNIENDRDSERLENPPEIISTRSTTGRSSADTL